MESPNQLTLDQLSEKVREFCSRREWDQFHDVKELAIGVITEGSELLELFRFRSKEECEQMIRDAETREKIVDEVADVLFFLIRLSNRYGIDLIEALDKKLKKNEEKYPVERARGSNRKYTEL